MVRVPVTLPAAELTPSPGHSAVFRGHSCNNERLRLHRYVFATARRLAHVAALCTGEIERPRVPIKQLRDLRASVEHRG